MEKNHSDRGNRHWKSEKETLHYRRYQKVISLPFGMHFENVRWTVRPCVHVDIVRKNARAQRHSNVRCLIFFNFSLVFVFCLDFINMCWSINEPAVIHSLLEHCSCIIWCQFPIWFENDRFISSILYRGKAMIQWIDWCVKITTIVVNETDIDANSR